MAEPIKKELSKDELEKLFLGIGLDSNTVQTTLKNKKLSATLLEILQSSQITSLPKKKGLMIYDIASTLPESLNFRRTFFTNYILKDKIVNLNQFKHALTFLKTKGKNNFTEKEFEEASGVGIEVTEDAIQKTINKIFLEHKNELETQRYKAVCNNQFNLLIYQFIEKVRKVVTDEIPFGEGKIIIDLFNKKVIEVLGEETEEDKKAKVTAAIDAKKKKPEPVKKDEKEEKKDDEEEKPPRYDLKQLIGYLFLSPLHLLARDIGESLNTEELLAEHKKFTGGKIHTRFPPEPNGYLHIGHAKAMRFSFITAQEYGGNCYLRFDDTNPEKENDEFIKSIRDNVEWLGYKPWKITHASENFDHLYNFAIQLIKKDKAYVCEQSKDEMKEDRRLKRACPYRNRPIEESLRMFENMRMGLYPEQFCCLKLKIDPAHPNPTMRDPVCYRIRYTSHPHVGDKWCIYPCYDFTHCVCDSLEHIDYSLCTLEFEIRRDLYYWVLENIGIYRPYQYEFSRLNISRNILSKRKLMELVTNKHVNGWDDPRLLTINGLRRHGYTREAINNFCDSVSVTRRGNEMVINFQFLEYCVRQDLNSKAKRTLAVIEPVKLTLVNLDEKQTIVCHQPFFPQEKDCKDSTEIHLTKTIYVEKSDVRSEDNPKFFGFAPGKTVGLKYAGVVKVIEVKVNAQGEFEEILAEFLGPVEKCNEKPKTFVHWISANDAIDCEVRLYSNLFKVENVNELENFLDGIDPNSLIIHKTTKMNKNLIVTNCYKGSEIHTRFQFERLGYFIIDEDSDIKNLRFVFNRIVTLVEKEKVKAMHDMK